MDHARYAVFPAVLFAGLCLYLLSCSIVMPDPVQASTSGLENNTQPFSALSSSCSLPRTYPESVRKWCSIIEKYATATTMEADLLAAVMLQESGGNPAAYSHSGAVGLMQVMPHDGLAANFTCINGPCFGDRPSMKELFDPEFNVAFGSKMLSGLYRRTGNLRTALQAYGPAGMGYQYADKVLDIQRSYRQ